MSDQPRLAHEDARKSYKIELDEKPCVVQFVESLGGFIVGTYDLLPTIASAKAKFPELSNEELSNKYESINQRVGSLNFLCPSARPDNTDFEIQSAFQCQHGGIFDISILNDSIYAAHANGSIARYEFKNFEFKSFETISVTEVRSTLLTSIDTCDRSAIMASDNGDLLVVVGDSKGCMTIVQGNSDNKLDKILSKCDITKYADPIWQVKFFPSSSSNANQLLILVAAEDSSWYIYKFHIQRDECSFQPLMKNQDFKAGVTSICLFPRTKLNNDTETTKLMLGSYDESIRMYEVEIDDNCELVSVKSVFDAPMVINGGGIWRINCVQNRVLYIAAMYAGTYRMNLDTLFDTNKTTTQSFDWNKIETNELATSIVNDKLAPLHYGVDCSPKDSVVCIADYNNNCCIFVDQ